MTNDKLKQIIKQAAKSNGNCVESFVEAVGGEDQAVELLQRYPLEQGLAHNFKTVERFMESEYGNLMEDNGGISATATSVFTLLGVTAAVVGAYDLPQDFMGERCMYKEMSKTFQEPKAWLYRPDLPDQLDDMEEPTESGFYPRSLVVTNSDFGKAWKISRRAIDDDQVGQFARIPGQIGEQHRNQEEIYFAGFLYGSNVTFNGVSVPVPTYTDPDGTLGVYKTTGTRANAITPAAISQTAIQDLITLSKAVQDPGGKTLLIRPNLLWGGTGVSFNAAVLLRSATFPSVISGASTPTNTGSFSSINPLDSKYGALRAPLDYAEQAYFNGTNDLPNGTDDSKNLWGMMETKKNGIIMQDRQPLEVLMESPNAGGSIRTRSYYYRTFRRFALYHGDARFLFRGSDGSV